ncbi:hypothetical protein C8F01DRAFT_1088453 [Mycena amicta]|nr:hypothetical protein C8F01DRAFT_1088453 [Mycena amicta]
MAPPASFVDPASCVHPDERSTDVLNGAESATGGDGKEVACAELVCIRAAGESTQTVMAEKSPYHRQDARSSTQPQITGPRRSNNTERITRLAGSSSFAGEQTSERTQELGSLGRSRLRSLSARALNRTVYGYGRQNYGRILRRDGPTRTVKRGQACQYGTVPYCENRTVYGLNTGGNLQIRGCLTSSSVAGVPASRPWIIPGQYGFRNPYPLLARPVPVPYGQLRGPEPVRDP